MRSGIFTSIYEPEPYLVINQQGSLYQLMRQSDNYTTRRHINDLKPYHTSNQQSNNSTHHHTLSRRWSSPTSTSSFTEHRHPSNTTTTMPPSTHTVNHPRIPPLRLHNTERGWVNTSTTRLGREIKRPSHY